jgi:hypothetical protein
VGGGQDLRDGEALKQGMGDGSQAGRIQGAPLHVWLALSGEGCGMPGTYVTLRVEAAAPASSSSQAWSPLAAPSKEEEVHASMSSSAGARPGAWVRQLGTGLGVALEGALGGRVREVRVIRQRVSAVPADTK